MSQLCQNKGRILYIKDATFALGCFILSGTELINIKSSVPRFVLFTSLPPKIFLHFCTRVQDGYGLPSTTSEALSVQVRMLTFSH